MLHPYTLTGKDSNILMGQIMVYKSIVYLFRHLNIEPRPRIIYNVFNGINIYALQYRPNTTAYFLAKLFRSLDFFKPKVNIRM